jgi:hypothetical protein
VAAVEPWDERGWWRRWPVIRFMTLVRASDAKEGTNDWKRIQNHPNTTYIPAFCISPLSLVMNFITNVKSFRF